MTVDEFLRFFSGWGDLASVIGCFVGIIGFAFAIYTLLRTKKAAEAARQAAIEVRERLTRVNTVAEFAEVLATIEEIKTLHRVKAWEISLARYPTVRRLLVSIEGSSPTLGDQQRAVLAAAIEQFRTMEQTVERARSRHVQRDPEPGSAQRDRCQGS